ncbi:hypothetical protein U0070_019745, partial [Myodes glareolus]
MDCFLHPVILAQFFGPGYKRFTLNTGKPPLIADVCYVIPVGTLQCLSPTNTLLYWMEFSDGNQDPGDYGLALADLKLTSAILEIELQTCATNSDDTESSNKEAMELFCLMVAFLILFAMSSTLLVKLGFQGLKSGPPLMSKPTGAKRDTCCSCGACWDIGGWSKQREFGPCLQSGGKDVSKSKCDNPVDILDDLSLGRGYDVRKMSP